ncbi:MAG: addiction module antidote protein, HigA family [Pseudoxanthomonas suwonensis]|nr:MAG: addiction module antidote protein, HigA family [Pseudoxanthomonas suwonensis]
MTTTAHPPIHPGVVLFEDYMQPMGLSQRRLADLMNVPPRRINEIIHGKRAITPDTSLRLGKHRPVHRQSPRRRLTPTRYNVLADIN